MALGWNVDTAFTVLPVAAALAAICCLLRASWKQYGLHMLLNAAAGLAICYLFVRLALYGFPFRLLPWLSALPVAKLVTVFPAYSALAVRYSPRPWGWKIPYYWVLVHLVTLAEAVSERFTHVIQYSDRWHLWESYALWWLFLLAFELLGGLIVRPENRKPLDPGFLRYGKPGFFILHAVLIVTFFLAGLRVGLSAG